MKRFVCAVLAGALLSACVGRPRHAGGPPPEYERPVVPPWDAGKSVDPLEQALERGEAVDPPPDTPDAAASADGAAIEGRDR